VINWSSSHVMSCHRSIHASRANLEREGDENSRTQNAGVWNRVVVGGLNFDEPEPLGGGGWRQESGEMSSGLSLFIPAPL
jgi:hypothetical protein